MWTERIAELCDDCKFHPPLSKEWISRGLAELDVRLNDSLESFLLETDGLYDYGQFLWICWNVGDLAAYNKDMRRHQEFSDRGYSFDDIFFIANYGTGGILFGFPIVNGALQDKVVAWYPESDNRVLQADSLNAYLKKWIARDLSV